MDSEQEQQQEQGDDAQPKSRKPRAIDPGALMEALRALPEDAKRELLSGAGIVPTTMGMTPEHLQVLMGTMTAVSANAQKEAIRSQRKENPSYPERSVFNPDGIFDDNGTALAPKVKFTRPTFFQNVRLGGELETPEEIRLCNLFTESRYSREGTWKAELEGQGINRRLLIEVPSRTTDERMTLPPFTMILRELLDGKEAVDTESLHRQIETMKAQIEALQGAGA